jgi:asparagine synthase (glutamine-hydrolysing)
MAYGLESRLPFMDYRLIEFAFTLPSEYLINDGKGKYILREALKDILPSHIYQDHKKLGFPSPVDDFFKKNKILLKSILLSDKAMSRGLYDYEKLDKLIDNVGNKNNTERLVFRLLCIEIWFDIFMDKR